MNGALLVCVIAACTPSGDALPMEQALEAARQIATGVRARDYSTRPLAANAMGVYWLDDGGLMFRAVGGDQARLSELAELTHVFADAEMYAYARPVDDGRYAITVVPLDGAKAIELEVGSVERLDNVAGGSVWYQERGTNRLTRRVIGSAEVMMYANAGGVLVKTQLDDATMYVQSSDGIVRLSLADDATSESDEPTRLGIGIDEPYDVAFAATRGRVVLGTVTEAYARRAPPLAAQISVVAPGEMHSEVLADYGEHAETSAFAAVPVGDDVVLLNTLGMFRVRADDAIERFAPLELPQSAAGGEDRVYYVNAGTLLEQVLP